MEPTNSSIPANDVLHIEPKSKLTQEEIAKALAHHNRHHHGDQPVQAKGKNVPGKKHK